MKKMERPLIALIALTVCFWSSGAFFQTATAAEKWESDMRKDFAKVLREKKKPAEKHRELILKWQKEGHLPELLALYVAEQENRTAQQHSNDAITAGFYYGLGYVHALHAPMSDSAIDYLKRALQIDADLFWARFNLGGIYQEQGENALALAEFETCVRLKPSYYPVYYRMGEIHLKQENYTQALQAFDSARKVNRKWEYPQYGIGLVYLAQGETDRARETFENLTQRKKEFAPAYFKLGQTLAIKGLFAAALETYAKGAKYEDYSAPFLHELALIFVEKGNTGGAIQLYQRVVEMAPTHGEAHFELAELYYAKGDTAAALPHYREAISIAPSITDDLYEPLASYFAGLIGPDEAMPLLEKATHILPDDPRAYFYAGTLEADAGNVQKAIEYYEKTLQIVEADPSLMQLELLLGDFNDIYLTLGELYHQQGDADTAVVYLKRALAVNPELAERFITHGNQAFEAENYQEAIEALNTHLLLFPDAVDAAYLLGQSYEAIGDTDNALTFYKHTLILDAQRPDVLFKMVHIYRNRAAHREAVAALQQIIAIAPGTTEAHYLLAFSYLSLEQPEAALPAFLATVELDPNAVSAHYHAAVLFEQRGEVDNAVTHYEKTIALDTTLLESPFFEVTEVTPFFRIGAIYRERQDEENILRVYPPALEIEPDHPEIHHLLAVIFEKRGERAEAIRSYGLANRYDPDNFEWHYRYARLLDQHAETLGEEYHEHAAMAIDEYTATIALKPTAIDAYFYRGMITLRYRHIGEKLYRYSQILEDCKQVVETQPKNREANYKLGQIYLEIDRHRLAKTVFEKMKRFAPKYRGVHLHLGQIAEWEQDWKQAIQYYEAETALIQAEPEAGDTIATKTYQRLGDLYYAHALDYNAAKETLEIALALDDTHVPTLLNYANNLFSMDLLGAATEQFELVIQLDPRNLTAHYNLALMYEYREKLGEAKAQWQRFLDLNPPEQWRVEAERRLNQ